MTPISTGRNTHHKRLPGIVLHARLYEGIGQGAYQPRLPSAAIPDAQKHVRRICVPAVVGLLRGERGSGGGWSRPRDVSTRGVLMRGSADAESGCSCNQTGQPEFKRASLATRIRNLEGAVLRLEAQQQVHLVNARALEDSRGQWCGAAGIAPTGFYVVSASKTRMR